MNENKVGQQSLALKNKFPGICRAKHKSSFQPTGKLSKLYSTTSFEHMTILTLGELQDSALLLFQLSFH